MPDFKESLTSLLSRTRFKTYLASVTQSAFQSSVGLIVMF